MNTLPSFLKEWASPTLAEFGFRKHGRAYRLETLKGGFAIVEARPYPLVKDLVTFFVEIAVSPPVLVEFQLRDAIDRERKASDLRWGDWVVRLRPNTETIAYARPLISQWGRDWEIDPPWVFPKAGDAAVCGRDLQMQLTQTVPDMLRMIDSSTLLAAVRAGPPPFALQLSRHWAEALLMSDTGDSPELQALLDRIDADRPNNPITPWVRARLASDAV